MASQDLLMASSMEAGKVKSYGSAGEIVKKKKETEVVAEEKIEMKPVSWGLILGCVVVPIVIFMATFYVMSFSIRYSASFAAYALAGLLLLVALGFGFLAWKAYSDHHHHHHHNRQWLALLCILSVVGWFWAFFVGNDNFLINVQPCNDLQQLNVYKCVDPSRDVGNQYMDFGVLGFSDSSTVDTTLAMQFKNRDQYCVAPIKVPGTYPQTYEFWAVGMNCCDSPSSIKCWDAYAPSQYGVRVMRESQREFYQLAAQKAASVHGITVGANALFFEYVPQPESSINGMCDAGMSNFISMSFVFSCVVVGVVVLAFCFFAKFHQVEKKEKVERVFIQAPPKKEMPKLAPKFIAPPSMPIQLVEKPVPIPQVQVVEKVVAMPQVQVVEKVVAMPEVLPTVQVIEKIHQAPPPAVVSTVIAPPVMKTIAPVTQVIQKVAPVQTLAPAHVVQTVAPAAPVLEAIFKPAPAPWAPAVTSPRTVGSLAPAVTSPRTAKLAPALASLGTPAVQTVAGGVAVAAVAGPASPRPTAPIAAAI